MTVYYVDDGGSASDPYDTWAKAATSLSALDDAKTFAAGDIIYIGHNHVCQFAHSGNRTITGPDGLPTYIISATQGSSPPAYQASSTNQIDTTEGAYSLTFDGAFALYGVRMASGAGITLGNDSNEPLLARNCVFALAANGQLSAPGGNSGASTIIDCTIDLTADGTTGRSATVFAGSSYGTLHASGLTFVNAGYRTGSIFGQSGTAIYISGCDFSGFTNATACEIVNTPPRRGSEITNCQTSATWAHFAGAASQLDNTCTLTNVGPVNNPQYLAFRSYFGDCLSSTAIYRSPGSTIESVATSWLITTTSACGECSPFVTPWIYGTIATTGSKTFDVYITNDTAYFDNSMVWLEVEAHGTTIDVSGTYSQTTTTVTCTSAGHGLLVGKHVYLNFTSGAGVDGDYTVVSVSGNDFTVTSGTSQSTSGNVTITKDGPQLNLMSDQRDNGTGAFISITEPVDAQVTDSTTPNPWNGTGPSFTYRQKLSATGTVKVTGQYRARVAVGVASIAGSRYFYVDPKVTVS
jgi:hypothetical protein